MRNIMFGIVLGMILLISNACSQDKIPSVVQPAEVTQPGQKSVNDNITPQTVTKSVKPSVQLHEPAKVEIKNILENPKIYSGKIVLVEGKIVTECPSGCWFTLKDNTATIYIDLNTSNIVIPQKKGTLARVTAEVVDTGGDIYLIGKKVEF